MSTDSGSPREQGRRPVRRDALFNRERILTAAAELMAERGRNVPLADIAEAAGVGVGTLYRGWPDRTALLHALEHRAYDQLTSCLDHIEESGRTGAEAVDEYLNECLRLGNQLVLPLRGAPPLADQRAIDARARIHASLERFLTEGRGDGSVRADVNATDVIMCGAMITQPLPNFPASRTVARRHVSLFVRGIRAPADVSLPGPAVTRQDLEDAFGAPATD